MIEQAGVDPSWIEPVYGLVSAVLAFLGFMFGKKKGKK